MNSDIRVSESRFKIEYDRSLLENSTSVENDQNYDDQRNIFKDAIIIIG